MTVIFVHMPKAGGTSLMRSFQQDFPSGSVEFDYNKPLSKPPLQRHIRAVVDSVTTRPVAPIVFGHFLMGKYARWAGTRFLPRKGYRYVTVLREPLQRAISHYHYWKRTEVPGHNVWERFNAERWSLERFLSEPELANFQSQFLWRFPLEHAILGVAEDMDATLALLREEIPELRPLRALRENVNPDRAGNRYDIDRSVADHFRRMNEGDYIVYNHAVRRVMARSWVAQEPPRQAESSA